jgi:hypothetical protein
MRYLDFKNYMGGGTRTKRKKCIEMLTNLGVEKLIVWDNRSARAKFSTQYRWEFIGLYHGVTCTGGCFSTMTNCAKSGRLLWVRDWHDGEVAPP